MKFSEWLETLRKARRSIESAESVLIEIAGWINENVVAHDVLPRQFPPALGELFGILNEALCQSRSSITEVEESLEAPLVECLAGRPLTKEQQHIIKAWMSSHQGSDSNLNRPFEP